MKLRTLQQIIAAYKLGDHITNAEMVQLRDLYHDVTVATAPFGKVYELVWLDAIGHEEKLNEFIRARGITSFTNLEERKHNV